MMEAVVTTGAIRRAKLQSNHHHQQTNTQFFTGRMPFLLPTNSVKALKVSCDKNGVSQSTDAKMFNYSYFPKLLLIVSIKKNGIL